MDEAQLAELQVLRERVVEVQALQVLLHFLHNSQDCCAQLSSLLAVCDSDMHQPYVLLSVVSCSRLCSPQTYA